MKEEIAEKVIKKLSPWIEAIEQKLENELENAKLFDNVLEKEVKNTELKEWIKELFGIEVVTLSDLYEVYSSAKISLEDEHVSAIPIQTQKGVYKRIYMPYEKFESYVFTRYQELPEKKKDILRKALGENINNAKLLWKAMQELEKEV